MRRFADRTLLSILFAAAVANVAAAQPAAAPSDFVLFGDKLVGARGLKVTSGNVGSNFRVFATQPLKAASSTIAANVVDLDKASTCATLLSNSPQTAANCGPATSVSTPIIADVAAACGAPSEPVVCDSQNAITVGHHETRELAPGTYGAVQVLGGGGGPGKLVLSAGTYTFCSLRVGRNASLVANGAVELQVAGNVRFAVGSDVGAPAAGSACDLHIFSNGEQVAVSRQATLRGVVCAPSGEVRLSSGSKLSGAAFAKTVHTDRVTVDFVDCATTTTSTTTITSTTVTTTSTQASSTTTVTSTTTTTDPCAGAHCGDGIVNCGEVCDPNAEPVACSSVSGVFVEKVKKSQRGAVTTTTLKPVRLCVDSCTAFDDSQCSTTTTTEASTTSTTTEAPTTSTTEAPTTSTTVTTTTSTTTSTTSTTATTTSTTTTSSTTSTTTSTATTSTTTTTTTVTVTTAPTTTTTTTTTTTVTVTTAPSTTTTTTTTTTSTSTTTSTTTTTVTSATATTATTLPTPTQLEFMPTTGSGFCGATYADTAGSVLLKNLVCGNLSLGGGFSTVADGPTPAGSANRFSLSCTGSNCTVGPINTGTSAYDCTTTGCRFGTPLPVPNGGLSVCTENTFAAPAGGTIDTSTGTAQLNIQLKARTVLTGNNTQPCPICRVGSISGAACNGTPGSPCTGVCQGSGNQGAVCVSTNDRGLTRDCPGPTSTSGGNVCYGGTNSGGACTTSSNCPSGICATWVGDLPVDLGNLTTGTSTKAEIDPNNATHGLICPNQALGQRGAFPTNICFGGSNDGHACITAADCPGAGSAPQGCRSNNNYCTAGTNAGHGCAANTDCGTGGVCTKAGSAVRLIKTFGTPAGAMTLNTPKAIKLGTPFCLPATGSFAIDASANLPGPGATSLQGNFTLLP